MHTSDQARALLDGGLPGHAWSFDWSAVPEELTRELLAQQRARTFMTSGTSGDPKSVVRHGDLLVRELDVVAEVLGSEHDWVHATVHPRSLYGYVGTYLAAQLGVPMTFDEWAATGQPIGGRNPLVFTVSASWRSVLRLLEVGPQRDLTVVHAGSTLVPSMVGFARSSPTAVRLLDLFGATETGVIGCRRVCPEYEETWSTVPDTKVEFPSVDELGEGRPLVSGDRVRDPAAADEVRTVELDDWLVPDEPGRFGFRGRRARLVKPGGRPVDLDLLEAQISEALPDLDSACVPRLHAELGEIVELLVVAPPGSESEVHRRLRRIPTQRLMFVPSRVTAVPTIPRSAMGKVRRVVPVPVEEPAS